MVPSRSKTAAEFQPLYPPSKQEEGGQRRSKRGVLSIQVSPWNIALSPHIMLTFHLLELKSLALVQVKEAVLLTLSDRQEQELGETVLSI